MTKKSISKTLFNIYITAAILISIAQLTYLSALTISKVGRGFLTHPALSDSVISEKISSQYENYKLIPNPNGITEERILEAMETGNAKGLTSDEMSLLNVVAKFTNTVNSYNDIEKVRYAVKYISSVCTYDLDAPARYTAYACLVNRRAVCSGYSRAMQLLMTASGIECYYVSGAANGADYTNHAWNIIKIDDEYCQCDVTWADNDDGTIDWSYIGMNDTKTSETRIWDNNLYPKCCLSLVMSFN